MPFSKIAKVILVNGLLLLSFALITEGLSYLYLKWNRIEVPSDFIGIKFDGTNRAFFKKGENEVKYVHPPTNEQRDYSAQINHHLIRHTPSNQEGEGNSHAIFIGCSNVFGQNNEDNETLPYYFSKKKLDFRAYNFGFPGLGPTHWLKRLQAIPLRETVAEKEGFAVVVLGGFHVSRVQMKFEYLYRMSLDIPYYYLDGNGNLAGGNSFSHEAPFRARLYKALMKSSARKLLSHFQLYPVHPHLNDLADQESLELFTSSLEALKTEYLQEFPEGRFFLYFMDQLPNSMALIELAKKRKLEILPTLPAPSDMNAQPDKYYYKDRHWKPLYNELLADFISSEVTKRL